MSHAVRPVKWGTLELVLTQKETLEALVTCSMEVNSFSSSLKVMKNIVSADPAFTLVFVHNMRRDGNVVQQKFRTGCSEVNSLWMVFVCFFVYLRSFGVSLLCVFLTFLFVVIFFGVVFCLSLTVSVGSICSHFVLFVSLAIMKQETLTSNTYFSRA